MDKSTDPLHHETPEKEWNEPLLHRAARVGDDAAIGVLIAEGADPNERFRDRTPLMTAAASGDGATVETVRLLLSLGADPTILNHGESAAAYACCAQEWYGYQGGDASRLSLLLEAGAPIPLTGSEAAALVATVAATGDVDRLRILLDEGAPVNPSATEADSHLYFPLFRAAESGSVECVRLLIERGAEVAMRDHSKRTAMYYASSLEVVKLLMRHGLSLADSDYMEWSPLRDAVSDGEFGLDRVRALVAAGANVNETHDRGFTIFMSAAGSMDRSVQVLRLLVEAGADPLVP